MITHRFRFPSSQLIWDTLHLIYVLPGGNEFVFSSIMMGHGAQTSFESSATCTKAATCTTLPDYADVDQLLNQFDQVHGPKPSDYLKKKFADKIIEHEKLPRPLKRIRTKSKPSDIVYKTENQANAKVSIDRSLKNSPDVVAVYVKQYEADRDKKKISKRLHSSVWRDVSFLSKEFECY